MKCIVDFRDLFNLIFSNCLWDKISLDELLLLIDALASSCYECIDVFSTILLSLPWLFIYFVFSLYHGYHRPLRELMYCHFLKLFIELEIFAPSSPSSYPCYGFYWGLQGALLWLLMLAWCPPSSWLYSRSLSSMWFLIMTS